MAGGLGYSWFELELTSDYTYEYIGNFLKLPTNEYEGYNTYLKVGDTFVQSQMSTYANGKFVAND